MVGIKEINRNLKDNRKGWYNLEAILNEKVSLDTDIVDFLLIASWYISRGSSIYKNAAEGLKQNLREYKNERRDNLSISDKHKETRFYNYLSMVGYGEKFKTIGDFKRIIENKGIIRPGIHVGIHYKTLAHFNATLRRYGIEPIKVGGRHTPAILRNLKKYSLEPTKKTNLYTSPK